MSLRTCATLMVKLLAAAVILGWVAFAGGGAVRAPCAVTAALMLVAVCLIHRLFWRCPLCGPRLGAAVGGYCTWCGERLRR